MVLIDRRRRGAAVVALATTLLPRAAAADGEVWLWTEHRIPLVGQAPDVPRMTLRLMTDTRFNGRSEGLDMAFLRAGPILHASAGFFAAAHMTVAADRLTGGAFGQQIRAELDLNPHGSLGPFTWIDRTRFEAIAPVGTTTFVRLRTMPRMNWRIGNGPWLPFVADEIFVDPRARSLLSENRFFLGLGRAVGNARLEAAYMLRSREAGASWEHDHTLLISAFFGAPRRNETDADQCEAGK